MRIFVLRARKGPTDYRSLHKYFGDPDHFEIIPHAISAALFVSKNIRRDTIIHIVLEGPPDPPKILTFDPNRLGYIGGFDETAITEAISEILKEARGIKTGEERISQRGIIARRLSFERLIRDMSLSCPTYILSKKGTDLRSIDLTPDSCFILTDHIGMQKKTGNLLNRLGIREISLGPKMLFAAHCIVLVHNELDRREQI